MKTKLLTKTLLASAVSLAIGTAAAAPYEIIDLGKIEGGTNSFAYGINDAGEVVGFGDGPLVTNSEGSQSREFSSHALSYPSTGTIDLGVLENGNESQALAVNVNGVAVGYSNQMETLIDDDGNELQSVEDFGVVFNAGSVYKIMGLEDITNGRMYDINNSNVAIGSGQVEVPNDDGIAIVRRAFIVNALTGGDFQVLESLQPGSVTAQAHPLSINENANIVGWSEVEGEGSFPPRRAFASLASDRSTLLELPNLGTPITVAQDINNNDVVVGFARISSNLGNTVAFKYSLDNDTELQQLPFFEDRFNSSVANAINDSGQIVGQALVSVPTTGLNAGFLFENDELKNLNELIACDSGWRIDNATNINNNGEIVGYGVRTEVENGETINEIRAFKLIPTGGSIEICEDDNNNASSNESSGGSWGPLSLLLLMVYGIRRKFI